MKVLLGSAPKGSIVVQCENPNCNAVIAVAPSDWHLWMGTLKTKCPCCGWVIYHP